MPDTPVYPEHRSTPLSEGKCPKAMTDVERKHEVEKVDDEGNEYSCICGCTFIWTDQTHWEVTEYVPAPLESSP